MLCINGDNCFRVLDNSKLVLFYFTANWCGPCQKISPIVEELSKKLSDKIDFYKIQIDDDGNVTVTDAEEDEEGIPTLSVITTMAAVAIIALRRRPE